MQVTTFNEFCFILWYYGPLAYDAFLKGNLTGTTSKIGTSPLFYFSEHHKEVTKHNWHMHNYEPFYTHENKFIRNLNGWTPPPYKRQFRNDVFVYDKPILTVHNKTTIEWNTGLFNYFDIDSLRNIFITFKDTHQIVYIRPPLQTNNTYYHDTDVKVKNIGDEELIKNEFPEVLFIGDLIQEYNYSYNELQMMLSANSERHIAAAGGESAIASYFGGDVLIYRHPTAKSTNRGVWHTNSYLKLFSGANIYGETSYNNLIEKAKKLWVD